MDLITREFANWLQRSPMSIAFLPTRGSSTRGAACFGATGFTLSNPPAKAPIEKPRFSGRAFADLDLKYFLRVALCFMDLPFRECYARKASSLLQSNPDNCCFY